MSNNKNIPDVNQSWTAAEKMLDRHFRMKKLRKAILIISVPVLVVVFSLFYNSTKKTTIEKNDALHSIQQESAPAQNENTISQSKTEKLLTDQSSVSDNVVSKSETVISNKVNQKDQNKNNSTSEKNITHKEKNAAVITEDDKNIHTKSDGSSTADVSHIVKNAPSLKTPALTTSADNKNNYQTSVSDAEKSNKIIHSAKNTSIQSPVDIQSSQGNGSGIYVSQQINSSKSGDEKIVNDISLLRTFASTLPVKTQQGDAGNNSWPKPVKNVNERKISWELSLLGGVHYINKSIESKNDWQNYLMHRRNEEDAIIAPSLGLAITAAVKSFSLSVGAEYSVYGEKTNYYPYSLQPTITGTSNWQFYITNYVDTDTAYITGNQLFLQTIRQQQDSAFVTVYDTTETYKYDSEIARKNGVNRFYYMEFPVEVSYCFTRGRTGFGVSGGVAPALLTNERGHYLRSDGKGVEAFSEIKTFRKFLLNARVSADFYYRFSGRGKFILRPQLRANLNSVFDNNYGIKQKYYSTGVLFGVSYLLN